MGCWIAFFGKSDNLSRRIRKFRKVFSVDGVPKLTTIIMNHDRFFRSVLWAWRDNGVPDVNVRSDGDGNVVILCGAVTDLGRYGSVSSAPNETAKNIMHLWKEHRASIIDQINGSWSLVFYNAKDQSVVAFTDRFASRAVWISRDGNVWIIGNFPSAIVTLRENSITLDPAGLWSLFQTSRHIPGRSLYSEVFSLIAGQKAVLRIPSPFPSRGEEKGGGDAYYSISNWYKRRYEPDYSLTPKEWGYRLACALKNSAKRIKRITPNPYLFLSGGLDSRIAAAAFGEGLKTITLCSSSNFESRVAKLVSNQLRLTHQPIIRTPYWYLDTLNASALISSGNYLVSHTHFLVPAKELCKKISDASFLLGDLLENLNKHYFSTPKVVPFAFNSEKLPYLLTNFIFSVSKNPQRLSRIFNKNICAHLQRCWTESIIESAKLVMDVSDDAHDRFDTYLRWVDVGVTYTYNMITCLWPIAGECNLFFDNDLNDLSLKIPSKIRGKGILHTWILWHLNKELLLIPDANNFLPPFMHKFIQNIAKQTRPKLGRLRRRLYIKTKADAVNLPTSGSWPLFAELYRRDKKYRTMIESLLFDKSALPSEIFDHSEIQNIWQEFLNGNFSLLLDINSLITFGSLNRLISCSALS